MPLTEATALLLGSGLAAAASGANAGFQGVRGKKNRELQKEFNEQQQKNWQAQFDYQKYINENQYRIQAKDQALAGINPIAANGGSLQGFSATAGGQAAQSEAPQIDATGALNMLSQSMQLKHDSYERKEDRENAKEIAKINAEASKHNAELSNEGTHYSSDTQAAIAAMNAENQKEIASLNTETQKKIAKWQNKTQKDLQKAMQEWQDSEDHAKAAERLQKALEDAYNYGRELEAMKHLYIDGDDGQKYRIDDYIKILEIDARAFENSPTRRSEDAIYRGLDRLIQLLTGASTQTSRTTNINIGQPRR